MSKAGLVVPPFGTKQNAARTAVESMYGRVPEMYELPGGAPFRRDDKGRVFDSVGMQIKLMGATAEILHELATDPAWSDTKVGAAAYSLQAACRACCFIPGLVALLTCRLRT